MARKAERRASTDAGLWHETTRDVVPLRGRATPIVPEPRPAHRAEAASPRPPASPPALPPLNRVAGIDRANAERLKRGMHPIEARLDLHGMTQTEAHGALNGFVEASRAAGRRCVLVITGHGRAAGYGAVGGGGILKSAVPRWLDGPELRHHLLAIAPAQPRHGGSGALYLLLRRQRS